MNGIKTVVIFELLNRLFLIAECQQSYTQERVSFSMY